MSQEQKSKVIENQIQNCERTIRDKIQLIHQLLYQQDKDVVPEIIKKINHFDEINHNHYNKSISYYRQFWKIYLLNEIIISKIKNYSITNKQITQQLNTLEEAQNKWDQLWTGKTKKKNRRAAAMIEKTYQCPFVECGKLYGSDVSLNLHLKIKHKCGTKTERLALAKAFCLAEEKGFSINASLNFPPGFLETFRKNFRN